MGIVHGPQCLPCIVSRMDSPAHARLRMGIHRCMLWMFFCTGAGLPVRKHQKQGKDLWSSGSEYVSKFALVYADLT